MKRAMVDSAKEVLGSAKMRRKNPKNVWRNDVVKAAAEFPVNARGLQFECAWVLHEALFVAVLLYYSETMIWRRRRDLE